MKKSNRLFLLLLVTLMGVTLVSCRHHEESSDPTPDPVVNTGNSPCSVILGRPTQSSITLNVLFRAKEEAYWEWGTVSGSYGNKSATSAVEKDVPLEVELTNLAADTKYYYRTRHRVAGESSFLAGPEYSFRTARSTSSFVFAIEADPHLDTNSDTASYALTLKNILAAHPDFLIDLGDTFMSEKQASKDQPTITARHLLLRSFFDRICHSVPLYLVIGNHEGELGWSLDGTASSLPVMASLTRNLYFPNPSPNAFYSGNSKPEALVGLRKSYYAFEWGKSLFVILDPYWYTTSKPGWGWTLGADQYNWFKNLLSSSKAQYKFVFCHQILGGNGNDARGGTEFVDYFEQGGNNLDGTYGFDKYRPGWGKPLHTLMKESKTNIFFHGHDHFYGKQEKDGIIYQECPQPSNRNLTNLSAADYGYKDGILLPGRGFIRVTVTDAQVKVDYVKTLLPQEEGSSGKNGDIAAQYTLP
ncbi:MAG: metallophosphoesterase [Marinilabiliales bacterium]|nr:metallophosphoesterase [Marinilabiliales bacterium]